MADPTPRRLGIVPVFAFSLLSFPLAGIGLPIAVYIAPFYAEDVGLGLVTTGFLFMIMRLWDVLLNPVVGAVIDRYRSRFGRVRHWIVLSVPILALATFFIYMPPRTGVGPVYFMFWMLVFYVGSTLLQTARFAWVPAIAVNYDDRSRYFQFAEVFSVLSMLALLIIPVVLVDGEGATDSFALVSAMGWALIVSLPITAALACIFVPDPPHLPGATQSPARLDLRVILPALKNPLLLRLLTLEFLVGTAISVTASNYLFVAASVFGLTDQMGSVVLIVFFIASVLAMPVWTHLAKATEKNLAFRVATLLAMSSYGLYFLVGQFGGFWSFIIGAVVNGITFTAPIVLIRSMAADVVEWQVEKSGDNRSGIYFGMLTTAAQVGASLAIGLGYLLVGKVAGYTPGAENSPGAEQGLLLIFCAVPGALYGLAFLIAKAHPLDRKMQGDIARALSEKV
jgi:glycoside/pentoside/hexuronide:cation symporter, GPH family